MSLYDVAAFQHLLTRYSLRPSVHFRSDRPVMRYKPAGTQARRMPFASMRVLAASSVNWLYSLLLKARAMRID